jgi:hypothetical protein
VNDSSVVLDDLAGRIREAHADVQGAAAYALDRAMAAGDLLIEAKSKVGHGGWLPWLEDACAIPERTAQAYMRLARNREELKSATVAVLGVRDALALLAEAKTATDPDVVDGVIADREGRRAVYEALSRREQTAETRRERMIDADPIASELRSMNALLDLSQAMDRYLRDGSAAMQHAAQLPAEDAFANRTFLMLQLDRVDEFSRRVRSYLETGKTDLDTFLDSVLGT